MKNKMLMVIALFAVMAAMTGIAMAEDIGIAADPAELTVSYLDTGTQLVTVTAPGGVISLDITGVQYNGNGIPFDLATTFTTKIGGVETTTYGPVGPGTNPDSRTFIVTYGNNLNAPNGDYTINYHATYVGGDLLLTKNLNVEADIIAIPEFPTVALPVAAVIGLVFFFHNRKNKEE